MWQADCVGISWTHTKKAIMNPGELQERLVDFAVQIGTVTDALPDTRFGRQIANQLVRSGTSPMTNYAEACGAESRRDFIHKLNVSLKEVKESAVWLTLILRAKLIETIDVVSIQDEAEQLGRILGKSVMIATSRT